MRIAVIMTCYNRKTMTKNCIVSLKRGSYKEDELNFFVVDDASTDGTREMIKEKFPEIKYLLGNGNLFWNKGMYLGFSEAVKGDYDFYLWVNDDVLFYDNVIENLVKLYESIDDKPCIISGYTVASDRKTITYCGQRLKKGIIPLNLLNITPSGNKIEKCDSMHGNCVFIPKEVVEKVGIIDPYYSHGFGDIDYGLRATKNHISIYVSDFPAGICEKNPNSNRTNLYGNKTFKERFRIMNSIKQRPLKDWLHFTKKFGGALWFLRFLGPYIKLALNIYK